MGALSVLSTIHWFNLIEPPFHVSQLHINLNLTSVLLESFASGLKDHEYDPRASEYAQLLSARVHI